MKERGLTIQEAIRSGRPFRRENWDEDWFYPIDSFDALVAEDILATDWELKPEKLEPVVWETEVDDCGNSIGYLRHGAMKVMGPLIGRKVRVTVEAIEGDE